MGEKLYAKMGFERVGVWRVPVPRVGHVEMPVLRNSAPWWVGIPGSELGEGGWDLRR
jgi:hypothetical protein